MGNKDALVLEYSSIQPEGKENEGISEVLVSLGCAAVPITGMIVRSGLLLIVGIGICSWLGLILAISGTVLGRRSGTTVALGVVGALINSIATMILLSVMIHGMPC